MECFKVVLIPFSLKYHLCLMVNNTLKKKKSILFNQQNFEAKPPILTYDIHNECRLLENKTTELHQLQLILGFGK